MPRVYMSCNTCGRTASTDCQYISLWRSRVIGIFLEFLIWSTTLASTSNLSLTTVIQRRIWIMDTIQAQIHLLTAHEMLINGGEWAVHPLHVRLPPPPIANGTEKVHYTICPDLDQALPERSPSELFNRFFVTLGDNGNNTFSFDFKFNKLPSLHASPCS